MGRRSRAVAQRRAVTIAAAAAFNVRGFGVVLTRGGVPIGEQRPTMRCSGQSATSPALIPLVRRVVLYRPSPNSAVTRRLPLSAGVRWLKQDEEGSKWSVS